MKSLKQASGSGHLLFARNRLFRGNVKKRARIVDDFPPHLTRGAEIGYAGEHGKPEPTEQVGTLRFFFFKSELGMEGNPCASRASSFYAIWRFGVTSPSNFDKQMVICGFGDECVFSRIIFFLLTALHCASPKRYELYSILYRFVRTEPLNLSRP